MDKPPQPGIGPQPVASSEIHCDGNTKVFESDEGRKVIINSIGGALKDWKGMVIEGPFHLVFLGKKKKGFIKQGYIKKPKLVETMYLSNPYWLVRLEANNFYLYFAKDEIKFLD